MMLGRNDQVKKCLRRKVVMRPKWSGGLDQQWATFVVSEDSQEDYPLVNSSVSSLGF